MKSMDLLADNPFDQATHPAEHAEYWRSLAGCSPSQPCGNCDLCEYRDADETPMERLRSLLLDTDGLDSIPEPVPLVPGILFRDSPAWLYGEPGCGKSFVAIDLAGCVGTGEPWQGFGPVQQGPALYLVAEGAGGIKQRVRAWEQAMGRRMTGVHFLPYAVQASNATEWQALCDLAQELAPALVIVDTQARVTVGMEENSNTEMGQFVHRVEQLRAATKACVLIIHHTGRSGDHMRGAIAIDGAATTTIRVEKSDEVLTLRCTKQKDMPAFDDFDLRLVELGMSAILAIMEPGTGSDLRRPAIRKTLIEWWNAHETDWVSVSVLIESKITTRGTFYRSAKALERQGLIEAKGEGNQRRYRLAQKPEL